MGNGVSFDGSANIDLPGVNTSGSQDTSGNAATATTATNVTVVANNSNNETVYPVFVDGATGSQGLESDTGLSYNPSSGILTSTKFSGQMTGNLYISGSLSLSAASYNGSTDVTITGTNTMGDGFILEDDDGTEVTITENKEVKVIGGTGIITNWTDTSHGTDGDPYDLTITCDLEGTELASTGESGGTKFLREDGDGTCSWQPVPDTDTTYSAGSGLSLSGTEFSVSSSQTTITSLLSTSMVVGRDSSTKIDFRTRSSIISFTVGNTAQIGVRDRAILPESNNYVDLGSSSYGFKDAYFTGDIVAGGDITAEGDITAFSTSDRNLKTNIESIENPINKLKKIGGYMFDWIEDKNIHSKKGRDIGVIAQEVEKIIPECVNQRPNGYKGVNYEKISY